MKSVTIILLLLSFEITAQSDILKSKILERTTLYNTWKERLGQKSGLFGNQTKADLDEINEVLKQIIKKDNEILEALETSQKEEYKTLQDKFNNITEQYDKLIIKNNGLQKKLDEEINYQKQNHSQIKRIEGDRILLGLVTFLASIILFWMFLKNLKLRKKLTSLETIIKNSQKN
jgi:hypothetical protein